MAGDDKVDGAPTNAKAPAEARRAPVRAGPVAASAAVAAAAPAKPKLVAAKPDASVEPKPKLVAAKPDAVEAKANPALDVEKNKIVHLVRQLHDDVAGQSAKKGNGRLIILSLLVCVGLPTLIAGAYYLLIASDRYVAEAHFAIRNTERQALDMLGIVSGMPSSQNVSDSYIVTDYLTGRDMIQELERRVPLREIYSSDKADFLAALDPHVPLEELVRYWQSRVNVYYDAAKNTIALQIQAFSPEDAKKITDETLDIVRDLVNDLSYRARQDAVRFASTEVARMELRLRNARREMLQFRVAHKDLDPAKSAEATLGIAAELEGERSKLASQLASVSGYLADDAPTVQMLKSRIAALKGEVDRIQGQISQGISSDELDASGNADLSAIDARSSDAMASSIDQYQELTINQEFAEKAYLAAMEGLERARAQADRTQSYLAIFGTPGLAQEAEFPHRWMNILVVLIFTSVLWAVGALGYLTVREHMP